MCMLRRYIAEPGRLALDNVSRECITPVGFSCFEVYEFVCSVARIENANCYDNRQIFEMGFH